MTLVILRYLKFNKMIFRNFEGILLKREFSMNSENYIGC